MLPGMAPVVARLGSRVEYAAAFADTSNSTTYTFAGADLGVAGPYRQIFVGVANYNSVDRSFSSGTIGGVSASLVTEVGNGGRFMSLITAAVPTGDTGTIAVTLSGASQVCAISIFAAYGYTGYSGQSGNQGGTVNRSVDWFQNLLVVAAWNGTGTRATVSNGSIDIPEYLDASTGETISHGAWLWSPPSSGNWDFTLSAGTNPVMCVVRVF